MTIKTTFILAVVLLSAMCAACTSGAQSSPSQQSSDRSLASVLYASESAFAHSQDDGDAIGMARAARERLGIIVQLQNLAPFADDLSPEAQQAFAREDALLGSARSMLEAAKRAADGNPDIQAKIDRMFPSVAAQQSGSDSPFSGIIGSPRKVELTIGLEMDARLEPSYPDVMRLPVAAATGTTIYVQPAGTFANRQVDLQLTVTPFTNGDSLESLACDRRETHGRLHCFLAPGSHDGVEIKLENHGQETVPVLIFVSGNATSVAAALARE